MDELQLLIVSDPIAVTITGRSLPRYGPCVLKLFSQDFFVGLLTIFFRDLPGYKSMFIRGDSQATLNDGDVTLCSVEELVLQHYKENGFNQGVHGEGSTICSLVGLLFWDVIYS